ncbi:hypothetical protein [Flavobacterium aquidurense]|uniref:hypothetical protein n=1 Tax=Flavobacterium aquidurense TaxID=362413 RepID=UPI00285BEF26|nr:hypothetical protein [Flavobacterium aquidurense]MDR7370758.1 hypothetical protein [Flavobacterium aquidurense]
MHEFIFNICCNITASFIFIFALLIFLKPKFDIVHFIAKNDSPFDNVSDLCYSFKIINKSFFGAYDIEARSNYYYIRQGENDIVNKVFSKIELKTSKVNFISGFKPFTKNYGDNCIQFFTYEDLSSKMNNSSTYIQFQITARHNLIGLNNIFTYNFVNKSVIVEGKFKEGNYKEIINC